MSSDHDQIAALHDDVHARMRARRSRGWYIAFAVAALFAIELMILVSYTLATGIGLWGNNVPSAWAFAIINFVWWIGIGHAGTFISAILYLLEQSWRTSISRLTETMTLFAVLQAAIFPVLHLGRAWFGYWLFPYPDVMGVWPQVKSALPWDAAAVSTYFLVSLMFWFLGLVPDFASLRDHASTRAKRVVFGLLALGWTGSSTAWRHYRVAYLMLASIATPLVISVHSIVASDFAIGLTPGWHSTLQPPFFVAGAIFSGFAMVLMIAIPVRRVFGLAHVITDRHLDNCAKLLLVTGSIVGYGYLIETFIAYYSGDPADHYMMFVARPTAVIFWVMLACNVVAPQLMWWRRARRTEWMLLAVSVCVLVGMWTERFVIIVRGLERDQLPSAWGNYSPTWVDLGIIAGTLGLFALLMMAFLRLFPFIAVSELQQDKLEGKCVGA
nr:NrfD/PsrC family molybdoenzyme membrane anchor subunit [Kofleriaceae bacterium]